MNNTYSKLSFEEREEIELYLRMGKRKNG